MAPGFYDEDGLADIVSGRSRKKALLAAAGIAALLAAACAAASLWWASAQGADEAQTLKAAPPLSVSATAQGYDASTSTPLVAVVAKDGSSTGYAVEVNGAATDMTLSEGEWTVAMAPPVNANGTTYVVPQQHTVSVLPSGDVLVDGSASTVVYEALSASEKLSDAEKRSRCEQLASALSCAQGDLASKAGTYTSLAYTYLGVAVTQQEADEQAAAEQQAEEEKATQNENPSAEENTAPSAGNGAEDREQAPGEEEGEPNAAASPNAKKKSSSKGGSKKASKETSAKKSSKKSSKKKTASCSHTWVKVYGNVKHPAQYAKRWVCITCSEKFESAAAAQAHIDAEHYNAAGKTGYREQQVKVKKAYKEYGVKHLKCSKCGKKKAAG